MEHRVQRVNASHQRNRNTRSKQEAINPHLEAVDLVPVASIAQKANPAVIAA